MNEVFVVAAGGSNLPDELQQVMLPIIVRDVCNQTSWYDGDVDDAMICAGYAEGGKDTCQVISDCLIHIFVYYVRLSPLDRD